MGITLNENLEENMKYCKKCLFPDTKPGIKFIGDICFPCVNHEKEIDWAARRRELETLVSKYRNPQKEYDCLVPVSGGKNSHVQVSTMKSLGMNPLLVCVDNLSWTDIGRKNFYNISETFGCDIYTYTMARNLQKYYTWKHFVEKGEPAWWWEKLVQTIPHKIAEKFNIKLMIYGEDSFYHYSGGKERIFGQLVRNVPGFAVEDYNTEPIFLSYFIKWSGYKQYIMARNFGFKETDIKRDGFIENYAQVDTIGYNINGWLKYPKFGFGRTTEVVSEWIREGRITREEAIKTTKEHDHKLDKVMLKDFLEFTGHTEDEFWRVVDGLWNKELFKEPWKLRKPIGG